MNILIALFGLGLNLSISVAQLVAGLLLLEWGWRVFKKKNPIGWRRSSLDLPIAVFSAWAIFSTAVHGSANARDTLSNLSALLLFFWATQTANEESTQRLFRWICIGAALAGAHGVLQALSGVNYLPVQRTYVVPEALQGLPTWFTRELALNNDRAMGPRNHPLTYAESFIPAFFLLLARLVREVKENGVATKKNLLIVTAVGLICGGVLLAQGRAVWLGLGLGILFFGWVVGRRFFMMTALVLAFGLVAVAIASPRLRDRLLSVATSTGGSVGDQQSKSMRYTMWRGALEGIRANPVLGVGLEGTRLTVIDPVMQTERTFTETHNMYLQIALETGLVGLGIFLWILIIITRMIGRAPPAWRPAFAGMFAAFLVAGLTESWPKDSEVAMLFWLMMGFLAVVIRNEKK